MVKVKETKKFRLVNSTFCNVYQHMLRSINKEVANKLIAETHEYTQKLVTQIIQSKLGNEFDFRIDFLLNVYREFKCNKKEKREIFDNLKDRRNEPLYYVDSGGLQLLRIRLGILDGSVEEFEKQIPELLEKQEELGDILMCLDYIPLWKRGCSITKSEIVSACYKTLEYINKQLEILKKKKSSSKLLPINQLTQLPPNGLIWYDIVKRELDFSDDYVAGYSLTGFINTGNKATENTMLYNVAWLTKIQQEIYNEINKPYYITHILGMVTVPNEFFLYGLYNNNFNHVSIDGVTYVKAYLNGYIWDFPFKNYKLNGFGEEFIKRTINVYSLFSEIIDKHLGWSIDEYINLLKDFHINRESYDECRFAMYAMRMFYTYYQQIVAVVYHSHKVEYIEAKYGKIYDKIKEDPTYFINYFSRNMETIPLINDQHDQHEFAEVEDLL